MTLVQDFRDKSPVCNKAADIKGKKQSLHMTHTWHKKSAKFKQALKKSARKRTLISSLSSVIAKSK